MEFKRYENETDDELIYRICSQKEMIGCWQDVADILNDLLDENYNESKYRKAYQAQKKIIDLKQESLADINEQLDELNQLKEDLRKERMKLQTVNIEKNRINRQDARYELFYEQIGEYIKKLTPPKLENIHIKKSNKKYIQTLADIHMGSEFVSANNEYSWSKWLSFS